MLAECIWNMESCNKATQKYNPQPIPVLGVQVDQINAIPFFATPLVTTNQQLHLRVNDFNRHDINASSGETDFFISCWLDINQPANLHYPQCIAGVSIDRPFNTIKPLFPIQQFIVGLTSTWSLRLPIILIQL
jgi:hypothetical protein